VNQYQHNKTHKILHRKYIESLQRVVASSEDLNNKQTIELINIEIENLPTKCREIFKMSKKEGLSNIEIAEYLKISTKTVESHITSAYKRLRAILLKKYKKNK
jgi:RNA polymerase sigma-70 factor (ECF subfamily)